MSRLTWSRAAVEDLVNIKAFLDQHDPRAALRIVEAIRGASRFLSGFPGAGPTVNAQMRSFRVRRTPYILIYRVLGGDTLEIARVRHAREDWRSE